MRRRAALKTIASLPVLPKLKGAPGTRTWLGPHYWANPLQDWRLREDRLECHVSGGDRNVFWLTRELTSQPGDFVMSVRLGALDAEAAKERRGWVGYRIGMRGHFNDYRDTAIRGLGIEAGVSADGRLFIGKAEGGAPRISSLEDVTLRLESRGTRLVLTAGDQKVEADVPAEWLTGGVALVCHAGDLPNGIPVMKEPAAANSGKPNQARGGSMRFWFRDWTLSGPKVAAHPERAWGPILFTQYTLSRRVLKMTVQLAPTEGGEPPVELRVRGRAIAKSEIETFSSTASFRIPDWDDTRDHPYELVYEGQKYAGTIRKNPKEKDRLVVGALTCQGDFGFPHAEIARNLAVVKPDILFFTGDQLYEANGGYGIQRGPIEASRLDYLRKWYMFGWAWGEFTRHIPCVCLPDDHDVYHGNLWGAAGRKAEYPPPEAGLEGPPYQQAGQDSGGYTMPARWVNLVQKTQSSHLPDPPDSARVDQDITVHYCHLVWGGVSFAVLEDRKWKSAPKVLMPEARIVNGWIQNPQWDSAKQGDVPGAQLLGERQEKFLEAWARDWADDVQMKAAVSATIFCNLCTLPKGVRTDSVTSKLPIQPLGGYAEGEALTQDHDSNGWPQTPRNRALRSLRSCLAVHIAGDQHLGSTVQYGIDDWNDASFAICTPAISNIFPRRWFPPEEGRNRKPGSPRNTGEYLDGFGNKMTVHAVANPHRYGVAPHALNNRAPGFGVVEFDKRHGKITLVNWPRWADLSRKNAKPYPGWPITIDQLDNGLSACRWELPLGRKATGLVEVRRDGEDRPVLMFRALRPLAAIPVWTPGTYSVRINGRDLGITQAVERTRA
jgi:PhoD-like phosphatase.